MTQVPSVAGRDIAELLAPQGPRRQRLDGFDADYADIVDYSVRCTHRIWEQKDVGLNETHYSDDCLMHLMTGPVRGAAGVIANTVATPAAFPDRTLVGSFGRQLRQCAPHGRSCRVERARRRRRDRGALVDGEAS